MKHTPSAFEIEKKKKIPNRWKIIIYFRDWNSAHCKNSHNSNNNNNIDSFRISIHENCFAAKWNRTNSSLMNEKKKSVIRFGITIVIQCSMSRKKIKIIIKRLSLYIRFVQRFAPIIIGSVINRGNYRLRVECSPLLYAGTEICVHRPTESSKFSEL